MIPFGGRDTAPRGRFERRRKLGIAVIAGQVDPIAYSAALRPRESRVHAYVARRSAMTRANVTAGRSGIPAAQLRFDIGGERALIEGVVRTARADHDGDEALSCPTGAPLASMALRSNAQWPGASSRPKHRDREGNAIGESQIDRRDRFVGEALDLRERLFEAGRNGGPIAEGRGELMRANGNDDARERLRLRTDSQRDGTAGVHDAAHGRAVQRTTPLRAATKPAAASEKRRKGRRPGRGDRCRGPCLRAPIAARARTSSPMRVPVAC
jgi:hypothetical protein